jgi:hypothetical protein
LAGGDAGWLEAAEAPPAGRKNSKGLAVGAMAR